MQSRLLSVLVASVRLLYNNAAHRKHTEFVLVTRTQPTREPAATRLSARVKAIDVVALVDAVASNRAS